MNLEILKPFICFITRLCTLLDTSLVHSTSSISVIDSRQANCYVFERKNVENKEKGQGKNKTLFIL